jgi:hypothetical protein
MSNGVPVFMFAGNEVTLIDGFYSGNNFSATILPLSLNGGYDAFLVETMPQVGESVEEPNTVVELLETAMPTLQLGEVSIYPNPAEGFVTVHTQDPIAQMCVYDIHGRLVFNKVIRADNVKSVEIDAASFESGIYLVKVDYTVGGWITDRLIINK